MKKKCPECAGFGIGAVERIDEIHTAILPCENCGGSGEIFVKFKVDRIKGLTGKFMGDVNRPWRVEYPDGDIRYEHTWDDAMMRVINAVVSA